MLRWHTTIIQKDDHEKQTTTFLKLYILKLIKSLKSKLRKKKNDYKN